MTQGLLTLWTILAISVGTPHYPEEREREKGGTLRGGAADRVGHIHNNLHFQSAPA